MICASEIRKMENLKLIKIILAALIIGFGIGIVCERAIFISEVSTEPSDIIKAYNEGVLDGIRICKPFAEYVIENHNQTEGDIAN